MIDKSRDGFEMSEVQSKQEQEKMTEEQESGELGEFAEMQFGLTDELADLFYEQDGEASYE